MEKKVTEAKLLVDFLVEWLKLSSRNKAKKMIGSGYILVGGKRVIDPKVIVNQGDNVVYTRDPYFRQQVHCPLDILYNDQWLVAVDKPAGLLTYGEKGKQGTSVYKILKDYFATQQPRNHIFVVHRLDKDVSGVLLFAKNLAVQKKMKDNWHQVTKKYYALVHGKPEHENGIIRNWLAEDDGMRVFESVQGEGKYAETHYEIMKHIGNRNITLLNVQIETGRKHQIRVHLSGLGCPVAGDRKYGIENDGFSNIRLQSYYICFKHPENQQEIKIEIPLRKNFLKP